jgi:uncharacterized membrane protein (DUF106 family)
MSRRRQQAVVTLLIAGVALSAIAVVSLPTLFDESFSKKRQEVAEWQAKKNKAEHELQLRRLEELKNARLAASSEQANKSKGN